MLPAVAMLGAAQHTVGAGEGPGAAPSNASAYPYGGNLVGVQWTPGDVTASTQLALTGGAEPTAPTHGPASAGATSFETGSTTQGFWWVRHAKNGQFSSWVLAPFEGGSTFPSITSVSQTSSTNCQVGQPVNIKIQIVSVGSSQMTMQRSVNGGAFAGSIPISAGATVVNRSETSGNNYRYRIRYDDVAPEVWSPMSDSVSAVCDNF